MPSTRADGGEHAGVVVGGDQLERALVEEGAAAGAPGCAGPRSRGRLGRPGWRRRVAVVIRRSRRRRRRWRRRSRRSCSGRRCRRRAGRARLVGDVELDLRVEVVEVDRRRARPGAWSARTVAIDSSAPAPPSRWPVIDLVLVTTTWSACAPSVAWIIRPSAMSPCGVEVAWALMCDDVGRARSPTPRSARTIARAPPRPAGSGWAMSWESAVMPAPSDLGVDPSRRGPGRAPRTRAPGRRRPRRARSRRGRCPTAGRPWSGRRCVLRQRHHVGERGHRQRVDRGLGAAGDDDVGAAEPDLVERRGRSPSLPEAQAETGVFTRGPGADVEADVGGRARWASASGRRAGRPGAGPSPCSTS